MVLLLVLSFSLFYILSMGWAETENPPKKSISQLINELKSDKAQQRALAARELGERKDKEAVPCLIESLKDKELSVKSEACVALGKIKDINAVPALVERLKDNEENWTIQEKAAEALVSNRAPEVFYALIDRLKYESEVKIKQLNPPHKDNHISPDEYIERKFADMLKNFIETTKENESYFTSLSDYQDNKDLPKAFRYRVAIILGQLNQKNAVPVLIECLKESEKGDLRALSAGLLGKLGDKKVMPYLIEALKDDYLNLGEKVSKDVGEEMIKNNQTIGGKTIFSAMKIEQDGDCYVVRSYVVRNNAAVSLHDLGLKVVRKGDTYEIVE